MYSVYSSFALLFIFCTLERIVHGQNEDNAENRCVPDQFKNLPELRQRFNEGLLKVACEKKQDWYKKALSSSRKAASTPVLTPSQMAWVNQVFDCFDLKCMCQLHSQCKEVLEKIEPNADNGSSSGKREPEKVNTTTVSNAGLRHRRAVVSRLDQLLTQRVGKAIRKELRQLTDEERNRFFKALNSLKTDAIDGLSKYDIMIVQHTAEYSPGAHFGASFLPFHREFSKNLEISLRSVDPTVALHYWDPTLDQGLPDARDSILWSELFLGNGDGDVITGPFRDWTTVHDSQFVDLSPNRKIVRNIGQSPYGSLYRDTDISSIMGRNRFRDLVFCVDPYFELVHGSNHLWIGGHMNELRISPNDPVFFFLHTFVDYIWEEWRQQKQSYSQRMRDYTSNAESCSQFSQAQTKMRPYSITNLQGLSTQYTDILYNYERKAACSRSQPDCGTPYLFCHTGRWKCLSKVKIGGNCSGLEGFDPCWNGQCEGGKCREAKKSATWPVIKWPTTKPGTTTSPGSPPTPSPTASPSSGPAQRSSPKPRSTITPPVPAESDVGETVWVPITVVSLNGRIAAPFPNAKILTTDESTSQQWTGSVADPTEEPYYTGQSFAQVRNPFSSGASKPIKASISVTDDKGRQCVSMCQERAAVYNPCRVSFSLVASSQSLDGPPYAQTVELAKRLNWQGNRHFPDRFLFMCPTGRSTSSPGVVSRPSGPSPPPATQGPLSSASQFSVSTSGDNSTNDETDDDITIKIVHSTGPNSTTAPSRPMPPVGSPSGPENVGPQPPTFPEDDCINDHRCCPLWAGVGECGRNPWMQDACRKVCRACQPTLNTNRGCVDLHPRCIWWARNGECKSNDLWMEENCKRSCSVCQRGLDELKNMCGASGGGDCVDKDPKCPDWAGQWECVNNPWWMKENCPQACNYCGSRSR